ncbi:phage tail terminator-like protein [Burkholderia ubonensis]|uniref:phage tail terminator-like protein n=1 Tax=Burkholderia ubonensis TaxID=101571 RepID=UPI000752B225|nr:phage tail terminator-like protein [Burkholderia ubonensis]KVT92707.1 hypothetical protein WK60_14045 [Burkholderia ubonensis]KVZ57512.1 hypothetical protein WL19_03345 [Burkholderia ubonensis]
MSDPVRVAFESRLAALVPALPTAWENTAYTPNLSVAFQKPALLRAAPENPAMGSAFYRETGVFQVMLCYPLNGGSGAADDRAKLIRGWFPRGSSVTASGVTVTIQRTPTIGPGASDGSFWCVPVSIPYYANILP